MAVSGLKYMCFSDFLSLVRRSHGESSLPLGHGIRKNESMNSFFCCLTPDNILPCSLDKWFLSVPLQPSGEDGPFRSWFVKKLISLAFLPLTMKGISLSVLLWKEDWD